MESILSAMMDQKWGHRGHLPSPVCLVLQGVFLCTFGFGSLNHGIWTTIMVGWTQKNLRLQKNKGTNLKSLSSGVSGLGSSEGGSGVWEMLLG